MPRGTYTWRIRWNGQQPAHVELHRPLVGRLRADG